MLLGSYNKKTTKLNNNHFGIIFLVDLVEVGLRKEGRGANG